MAFHSRAGWMASLGVVGVAGLIGVSTVSGQGDGSVQKTSGTAGTAAATRPTPAVVGSIDLEAVFRGYEKSKFHMEQLKAEALSKEGKMKEIVSQAKQVAKEMESLTPGTKDFKDRDAKLTQFKAQLQAEKETAERDGQAKYAEIMAQFYKEVQSMVGRVAKSKGVTYVVRVSNEPINSQDPEGVMAAMARPVMYSDPNSDLTNTVVYNLNREYEKIGGPKAKSAAATDPAAETAPAAAPSPDTAKPAANTARRPAAGTAGPK